VKLLVMFYSKVSRKCQTTKVLNLPRCVSVAKSSRLLCIVGTEIENESLTVMLELMMPIVTTVSNVMEGGIFMYSNYCL
jgi:hypothetical protein